MVDSAPQKKLQMLFAITELHHQLGAKPRLEEVGALLVDILSRITGCDACAILLIDEDEVKILAEKGFKKDLGETKLSPDMAIIRHLRGTKDLIFSNDLSNDPFLSSYLPRGCLAQSLICAPIVVHNELKGIVHLDCLKKNAFDEDDIRLVELVGEEIAIALERSFLYERIEALAFTDALTNIFNRRRLEEDLENEIARSKRYARPLSVLMIDIDHFKNYNDHNGHQKGDELLKKIALLLKENTRSMDRVYRYGGEEFVVILPEVDKGGGLACGERLRKKIEEERFEGEKESQPSKKITVSIGIATHPFDGDTKEKLIAAADFALYRAKALGRNRVCIY